MVTEEDQVVPETGTHIETTATILQHTIPSAAKNFTMANFLL